MLLNVSARGAHGLEFQGGVNTGKTVQDYCAVRAQLPETQLSAPRRQRQPANPYCHDDPGFITKVTGARLLHRAEDRRAVCGDVPQRPGRAAARNLECAGRAGLGGARPAGRGGRQPRCRST